MNNQIIKWLAFNLRYLKKPPWDTGITPPELTRFISSHPKDRALDLGAGDRNKHAQLNACRMGSSRI